MVSLVPYKMVDTGELESFLNDKSCKDGDIVEILEEGSIEEKTDAITKNSYRVLNLPVSLNGRKLLFTPNKDAVLELSKAYGKDSKEWKGKKFTVKLYPKMSFGKTQTAIMPVPIVPKKA